MRNLTKFKKPNHRFGLSLIIACYETNLLPCLMKNIHGKFGLVIFFHAPKKVIA